MSGSNHSIIALVLLMLASACGGVAHPASAKPAKACDESFDALERLRAAGRYLEAAEGYMLAYREKNRCTPRDELLHRAAVNFEAYGFYGRAIKTRKYLIESIGAGSARALPSLFLIGRDFQRFGAYELAAEYYEHFAARSNEHATHCNPHVYEYEPCVSAPFALHQAALFRLSLGQDERAQELQEQLAQRFDDTFGREAATGLAKLLQAGSTAMLEVRPPAPRIEPQYAVTSRARAPASEACRREAHALVERLKSGELEAGSVALEQLLSGDLLCAEAYLNLAIAQRLSGKLELARTNLLRALTLDGRFIEALLELAILDLTEARRNARLGLAHATCSTALELAPGSAAAHHVLGLIDWARGARREALASLKRAVSLPPASLEPRLNLGAVALEVGDLNVAKTAFESALELSPTSPEARAGLEQASARLAQ
jgi:tetratricopeptide (TPR) repeat protein